MIAVITIIEIIILISRCYHYNCIVIMIMMITNMLFPNIIAVSFY